MPLRISSTAGNVPKCRESPPNKLSKAIWVSSNTKQFAGDTWSAADIANINDCPYVQIITEDKFDAIARQVVRLR